MLIIDAWRRWPPPRNLESLPESTRRGILETHDVFVGIDRRLTRNFAIMLAWAIYMLLLLRCP